MVRSPMRRPFRPLNLLLKGGLVVACALVALPSARATQVRAAVQSLQCEGEGWCVFPQEEASLTGAFRQGDTELQFEALRRPYVDPLDVYDYPAWCVRLTAPDGTVFSTLYGNPECLAMWFPNYREPIDVAELSEQTRRIKADGPIVFAARRAQASIAPPEGRQEAWLQVQGLLANFADTVSYLSAQ